VGYEELVKNCSKPLFHQWAQIIQLLSMR